MTTISDTSFDELVSSSRKIFRHFQSIRVILKKRSNSWRRIPTRINLLPPSLVDLHLALLFRCNLLDNLSVVLKSLRTPPLTLKLRLESPLNKTSELSNKPNSLKLRLSRNRDNVKLRLRPRLRLNLDLLPIKCDEHLLRTTDPQSE